MLVTLLVLCIIVLFIPLTAVFIENRRLEKLHSERMVVIEDLTNQIKAVEMKNSDIISKKVAADVRLGAISENLLPLLTGLPYNPKDMHHLAQPIDYLYFNYDKDDPSITFIEVKSGNAKESPRQKLIKKIIKEGKIHYDLVRINEGGVKVEQKV